MLSHEWRELEVLCDRLSTLRLRFVAAQRTKNVGVIEGLKDDIVRIRRQRERLVQHISARLGSVAADHDRGHPATAPRQPGQHGPESARSAEPIDSVENKLLASVIHGFHDKQ